MERQLLFVIVGIAAMPEDSVCYLFDARGEFLKSLRACERGQRAAIEDILLNASVPREKTATLKQRFNELSSAITELEIKHADGAAMPPEWLQKNLNVVCSLSDAVCQATMDVFAGLQSRIPHDPPRILLFVQELNKLPE